MRFGLSWCCVTSRRAMSNHTWSYKGQKGHSLIDVGDPQHLDSEGQLVSSKATTIKRMLSSPSTAVQAPFPHVYSTELSSNNGRPASALRSVLLSIIGGCLAP